jgi:hypothetical protein
MPQLRVLWLSHYPRVADVRALVVSSSITTLSLQQTSVTDQGIAGLERMPSLSELVVAHTAVTDVRRFAQRTMPMASCSRRPHEDDRRASRRPRVDHMNHDSFSTCFFRTTRATRHGDVMLQRFQAEEPRRRPR